MATSIAQTTSGVGISPRKETIFGSSFWLALMLLVILGCGSGYIVQLNQATKKGYELKNLEKHITSLRSDTARFRTELAISQSMETMEEQVRQMGMIEIGEVEFLTLPKGPVAVAR